VCVQVWSCATELQPLFGAIDARVAKNLARVQAAFKQNRIGPHHFQGSTGYGHGDLGREALDNVSSCQLIVSNRVKSQLQTQTAAYTACSRCVGIVTTSPAAVGMAAGDYTVSIQAILMPAGCFMSRGA